DTIILGRIHRAVGNADVSATIDVKPITVGVDLDVADSHIVHAGRQQDEPPTLENGEVFQIHVAAQLERNGLVALPLRRTSVTQQPTPPDHPGAEYGNILEVLTPDETVPPVTVAKILVDKVPPEIGLTVVVTRLAGLRLGGGNDGCAVIDQQSDV